MKIPAWIEQDRKCDSRIERTLFFGPYKSMNGRYYGDERDRKYLINIKYMQGFTFPLEKWEQSDKLWRLHIDITKKDMFSIRDVRTLEYASQKEKDIVYRIAEIRSFYCRPEEPGDYTNYIQVPEYVLEYLRNVKIPVIQLNHENDVCM